MSFEEGLEGDHGSGIEYNGATFLIPFQEGSHQKLFFQRFFQNSATKIANWIIVYIVNSHVITGKPLATHS